MGREGGEGGRGEGRREKREGREGHRSFMPSTNRLKKLTSPPFIPSLTVLEVWPLYQGPKVVRGSTGQHPMPLEMIP